MASIPASESDFRKYVELSGYADIHTTLDDAKGQDGMTFTLTTGYGYGDEHTVFLFGHAKRQSRVFASMKTLSVTMIRLGFKAIPLPLINSGTRRCTIERMESITSEKLHTHVTLPMTTMLPPRLVASR